MHVRLNVKKTLSKTNYIVVNLFQESNDNKGNTNNSPEIQPEKKIIKRPKLEIKRKQTNNGKVDSDETNEKHILLDDSESDNDDEVKKENQDILETVRKGHKIPHPYRVPKAQIIPNKPK